MAARSSGLGYRYKNDIRWKNTVKGFTTALFDAGSHLTGWTREWMGQSVEDSLRQIDAQWPHTTAIAKGTIITNLFGGDRTHPWYSGQLHDSVAGIVSDKSRLVAVRYMPERAEYSQTYEGQPVNGHELAVQKSHEMARVLRFVPGVAATLVVGVPYANKVDETSRHYGFMGELAAEFAASVEDFFYMRAEGYSTRVYRTK